MLKWRWVTTCETHYIMILLPIKISYHSGIEDTTYRTHIIMDIKPNQHTVNVPLVPRIMHFSEMFNVHYLFTSVFSEIPIWIIAPPLTANCKRIQKPLSLRGMFTVLTLWFPSKNPKNPPVEYLPVTVPLLIHFVIFNYMFVLSCIIPT